MPNPAPNLTATLRSLTPDDAQTYGALRLRALREHATAFTSSFEEETQRPPGYAVARLGNAHNHFWGAFVQGQLVGMVGLDREARIKCHHKATVVGMYVTPEAKGQALGWKLMQGLLAQARLDGLELLVLTVTAGNTIALGLYERCGFVIFGTEPRAIKVSGQFHDKIHMALCLTPS